MYIIGVILLFILPFAAGIVCKSILRWKETNQIETYLIGFFFLFFLQAVVLIPFVWMGKSLTQASGVMTVLALAVLILGLVCAIVSAVYKSKKHAGAVQKMPWKKTERAYALLMIFVFLLLLLRMALGMDLLRNDIVLETVQTTLQSDGLFVTHPLTGRVMEAGMIASKKIVTLPLFYACISQITGVDADVLLYFVMNAMVLLCSYFSVSLLFSKVSLPTRGKRNIFLIIYGLLILAGDYHMGTISYRLLYQGYEGMTICFGVILPYLLYLIISWYKKEIEEEKNTLVNRMMHLLKILLGLVVSVLVTGLGTGFVFLFMAIVLAGVCCLLKSVKEVRECKES